MRTGLLLCERAPCCDVTDRWSQATFTAVQNSFGLCPVAAFCVKGEIDRSYGSSWIVARTHRPWGVSEDTSTGIGQLEKKNGVSSLKTVEPFTKCDSLRKVRPHCTKLVRFCESVNLNLQIEFWCWCVGRRHVLIYSHQVRTLKLPDITTFSGLIPAD
jgi:hypothetical protein